MTLSDVEDGFRVKCSICSVLLCGGRLWVGLGYSSWKASMKEFGFIRSLVQSMIASAPSNHCDYPKTRVGPLKLSSTLLLVSVQVLITVRTE